MEYITTERKNEILGLYNNGKKDLFNWCQEYKSFVNECVLYCVSSEWDYMLKKSIEGDTESPVQFEEIDFNDYDQLREEMIYKLENEYKTVEEQNDLREEINLLKVGTYYLDIKEEESIKEFIESLDDDETRTLAEEVFNLDVPQKEIYEYWLLSDPLKYRLEKQGESFINGAWGRMTTGQSISLDYCVIKAFISLLEDNYN